MTSDEYIHIGEVAERCGLSLRTLRHYDEIGLVCPTGRSEGNFRLYSAEDVERLLLVRRMKPLGFSLEEMAQLLTAAQVLSQPSNAKQRARAERELEAIEIEAISRRADLAAKLAMADEFIARLRDRKLI